MSKLTIKQDCFCRKLIETGNGSEAYRRCYNVGTMKMETIHRRASEVLSNSKVTARVAELQAESAGRHNVSIAQLTDELRLAADIAKEERLPTAMVSATMALAKLHGFLVHKEAVSQHMDIKVSYKE